MKDLNGTTGLGLGVGAWFVGEAVGSGYSVVRPVVGQGCFDEVTMVSVPWHVGFSEADNIGFALI